MSYRDALNIEDLRRMAEKRLPRVAYDFLAGGVEDDVSLANNRAVFERIRLRPHTLVDVSGRSQQVSVFGKTFNARSASRRPAPPDCMVSPPTSRLRARHGMPAFRSCSPPRRSSRSRKSRGKRRAARCGFSSTCRKTAKPPAGTGHARAQRRLRSAVVTTDLPVQPNREYNQRNGFTIPFKLNFANMIDGALHPRWLCGVFLRTLLDSGVPRFQNLDTNVGGRIIAKPIERIPRAARSAQLGGFPLVARAVAAQAVRERHAARRRRAARRRSMALTAFSFPITAGGRSMARFRRSRRCRQSAPRWAGV